MTNIKYRRSVWWIDGLIILTAVVIIFLTIWR